MGATDSAEPAPAARCEALLRQIGFPAHEAIRNVEPLSGGVSSDVFKVDLGDRLLCLKFASEQLRVRETWRAPLRRSGAEFEWLSWVRRYLPQVVPETFGHDPGLAGFAMEYLPGDSHPTWKQELLAGRVDKVFAREVGSALSAIHSYSASEAGLAERFATQEDFEALRLEPYFRFTASRHPSLAAELHRRADELASARLALVHGDVSPKNILCGPAGPVFIDSECAVFGDPAFDPAFCLNHLLIKAAFLPEHRQAMLESADAFWSGYRSWIDWESAEGLEGRVAVLVPALMLARVDGKSPLDYLTVDLAHSLRAAATGLFASRTDVAGLISRFGEYC